MRPNIQLRSNLYATVETVQPRGGIPCYAFSP